MTDRNPQVFLYVYIDIGVMKAIFRHCGVTGWLNW